MSEENKPICCGQEAKWVEASVNLAYWYCTKCKKEVIPKKEPTTGMETFFGIDRNQNVNKTVNITKGMKKLADDLTKDMFGDQQPVLTGLDAWIPSTKPSTPLGPSANTPQGASGQQAVTLPVGDANTASTVKFSKPFYATGDSYVFYTHDLEIIVIKEERNVDFHSELSILELDRVRPSKGFWVLRKDLIGHIGHITLHTHYPQEDHTKPGKWTVYKNNPFLEVLRRFETYE